MDTVNKSMPQPYAVYEGDPGALSPVAAVFWVACNGHASDPLHRPCPRVGWTYLYAPRPVFSDGTAMYFSMAGHYYRIPDGEKNHVQYSKTQDHKECTMKKNATATIEQPAIVGFPTSFEDDPKPAKVENVTSDEPKPTSDEPTKKKPARRTTRKKLNEKKQAATNPKPADTPTNPRPIGAGIIRFAAPEGKGQEWIENTVKLQAVGIEACRTIYGDTPAFEPTSLYKRLTAKPGKTPGKLCRDEHQLHDLGVIAHDLGWTNPEFLTEPQVSELGGKVKDGVYRHMLTFKIGTSLRRYYVVNSDDVEWPEGKVPEAKPEKPKTTSKKKNAPKGAAPKPIKIQLANGSVIYFDDPAVAAAFTLALGNA